MRLNDATAFSLVDGGTMHKLLKRFGRVDDRDHLFLRAAVACAVVSWLPLLLLSIFEGVAWGDKVTNPFLYDPAAYTRFLVAMPLLVIAESIIGPEISEVALHFLHPGRITQDDHPAYRKAVDETVRLRDSEWAEAIVVFIAYVSTVISMMTFALTVSNWRWPVSDFRVHFTLAAWWRELL